MKVIEAGKEPFRQHLKDALRRLKREGVSQAGLARKVGVSRAAITAWLQGTKFPTLDHARILAAICDWQMREILAWYGIDKRDSGDGPNGVAGYLAGGAAKPLAGPSAQAYSGATSATEPPEKDPISMPRSNTHQVMYSMLDGMDESEWTDLFLETQTRWNRKHLGGQREPSGTEDHSPR